MKNKRIKLGAIFAIMLLMAATAMPAIACDCEDKDKVDRNDLLDSLNIENMHGSEKLATLVSVISNKDTISIIKDLHNKGYKLQYDKANVQKISVKKNGSQEALMVIIPAESKKSSNSAQVVFTSNKKNTSVGNLIIEDGENYRKIEVCEINNGGIKKNYIAENRAGTISIDGKTIITKSQIKSETECETECDVCLKVCSYLYGAGCGLGGVVLCSLGCACITGAAAPLCPGICFLLVYALCEAGSNDNCPRLCEPYC